MVETKFVVYCVHFPSSIDWSDDDYLNRLGPLLSELFPTFKFKMAIGGVMMTKFETEFDRFELSISKRIDKKFNENSSKIFTALKIDPIDHHFKTTRIFTDNFIIHH
jgi:hypothetical protein